MWISVYAAAAVVVAIAAVVLAGRFRTPGVPAPDNPSLYAVLAGLLWPVVLVGVAQWALIAAVAERMRREPAAAPVRRAPAPAPMRVRAPRTAGILQSAAR